MIEKSQNYVDSTEAQFEPSLVRFDEVASANAKPVQPIPTSRVSDWIQRAHHARQMLTPRTKALALVLVGGLAIGTLGETLLVKEGNSTYDESPPAQESTSDITAAKDATKGTGLNEAVLDAHASAVALQTAGQNPSRIRNRRIRPPVQRIQRAYRVAVIR